MHRALAVGAILIFGMGAAHSADIFNPASDRLLAAKPAAKWTGPYIGFQIGYGWADFEATNASATVTGLGSGSLPLTGFTTDLDSFNGGLTVGYNFYASNVVGGIEADVSFGDFEYNSGPIATTNVLVAGDTLAGSFSAGFEWFGTLRARAGYLVSPRLLVYGTGGLAFAAAEADITYSYSGGGLASSGSFSDDHVEWGWTVGLGVEDRFTDNLSLKLEYLYIDFQDPSFTFTQPGISFGFDADASMHLIRTGLNYHF